MNKRLKIRWLKKATSKCRRPSPNPVASVYDLRPIPIELVTVSMPGKREPFQIYEEIRSDASGRFKLPALPLASKVQLDFRVPGYAPPPKQAYDLTKLETGIIFGRGGIPLGASIQGAIIAQNTGKPVGPFSLKYRNEATDLEETIEVNPEGLFKISDLPPGEAILSITSEQIREIGYSVPKRTIQLAEGQTIADLHLVAQPCALITGRITDRETKQGLPDFRVLGRIVLSDGQTQSYGTIAGVDGTYQLSVPLGDIRLTVHRKGWHSLKPQIRLRVDAGEKVADIDFVVFHEVGVEKAAVQPTTQAAEKLTFGPVIEATLDARENGKALDLDTGRQKESPFPGKNPGRMGQKKWAKATGMDLEAEVRDSTRGRLFSYDGRMLKVKNRLWAETTLANQATILPEPTVEGESFLVDMNVEVGDTLTFRTREGGVGMLQILGFTEDPKGIKIRYKMLQTDQPAPTKGVDIVSIGGDIFDSTRLRDMLLQARTHMGRVTSAYKNEDWDAVDAAAKEVRDIFRMLANAIEVDSAEAVAIIGKMQSGAEINKNEVEKVNLWKLKRALAGRATNHNEYLRLAQLISDIADVSDELHDAIRDKEMDVVAGYYDRLAQQWKRLSQVTSINELLRTKPGSEATQKPGNFVYVMGAVRRPGTYQLSSELKVTALRMLAAAAFDSSKQDQYQVQLLRMSNDRWQNQVLNIKAISGGQEPDVQLQAGDMLVVADTTSQPVLNSFMVKEGFGIGKIALGLSVAQLIDLLGPPDERTDEPHIWLQYRQSLGIDIIFPGGMAKEIRFNKGFIYPLQRGPRIGTPIEEVFRVYGKPTKTVKATREKVGFADRVLYKVSQNRTSKIAYRQQGVLFWFDGQDKVMQFVIFKPGKRTTPLAENE